MLLAVAKISPLAITGHNNYTVFTVPTNKYGKSQNIGILLFWVQIQNLRDFLSSLVYFSSKKDENLIFSKFRNLVKPRSLILFPIFSEFLD